MGLLKWMRKRRRGPRDSSFADGGSGRGIFFEGGAGDTVETAIVVRGAGFDLEGTSAEFAWLVQRYGRKEVDWKLLSQSHGEHGNRDIDTFEIELADGTPLSVFFDCTESFGKSPPPAGGSIGREDDTLP